MYSIYQTKDLKCFVFPKGFDILKLSPDNCLVIKTETNTIITDLLVNSDMLKSLLNFNLLTLVNAYFVKNKEFFFKKPVCVVCKDKLNYLTKNCTPHNIYLCDKFNSPELNPFSLDLKQEKFIQPYLINKDIGKVKVDDLNKLVFAPKVIKQNKDLLKKRYEFAKSQREKQCSGCVLACKKKLSFSNCYISKERLDKFLDRKIQYRFGSQEKFLKLLSYCSRLKDVEVLDYYADKTKTLALFPVKKDELLLYGKVPKSNYRGVYFYREKLKKLKPLYKNFTNIQTARLVMLLIYLFDDKRLLNPKLPFKQKDYAGNWQYLEHYHIFDQYFDRRYFRIDFALKDDKSLWIDFYHNFGYVKEVKERISDYAGLFKILPKPVYLEEFLNAVIDRSKLELRAFQI